ncbi:putative SOS response-associated peptidase YedK [bioreactor metagenome]|uniref:Putative SOS response-associated peptidase YedK n=1 Tax=bioreactor metagenome TaxID=1076179 RepID=A0A645CP01_9ZZZZ
MCGRYYIEVEDKDMHDIISEIAQNIEFKTGEVFPTNVAPVLAPAGELTAMRWGFPRFDGKGQIINARSETAGIKAMFRQPIRSGRCLIPASWYFEWEKQRQRKIKYVLKLPHSGISWLAGLSRTNPQTGKQNFVILTRPAWAGVTFIHDRMPVILPKTAHDEWLNGHDPDRTLMRALDEVEYRPAST